VVDSVGSIEAIVSVSNFLNVEFSCGNRFKVAKIQVTQDLLSCTAQLIDSSTVASQGTRPV
jgi:hypothetical protein